MPKIWEREGSRSIRLIEHKEKVWLVICDENGKTVNGGYLAVFDDRGTLSILSGVSRGEASRAGVELSCGDDHMEVCWSGR